MSKAANRWQQSQAVERETGKRLHRIVNMSNPHEQRAVLAKLRRGVGRQPGEVPELWAIMLEDLPEDMQSVRVPEPSREEWAIHIALTLYALHQQGKDVKREPMHQKGIGLGSAARQLAAKQPGDFIDNRERVARRFNKAAMADSMAEMEHYLRGFVQLLRANAVALDYETLAGDLYRVQFEDFKGNVRLRWGEDFYAGSAEDKEDADNA